MLLKPAVMALGLNPLEVSANCTVQETESDGQTHVLHEDVCHNTTYATCYASKQQHARGGCHIQIISAKSNAHNVAGCHAVSCGHVAKNHVPK